MTTKILVGNSQLYHTQYTPLNHEIKRSWLKALISGEYTRILRYLHTSEGFCALGVLCELYRKEHPETCLWKSFENASDDVTKYSIEIDGKPSLGYSILAPKIREWAGFSKSWEYQNSEEYKIWQLNDIENLSFKEIARWIDINL